MAEIKTYAQYKKMVEENEARKAAQANGDSGNAGPGIRFLKFEGNVKNALVRFAFDSVDDIEFNTVHGTVFQSQGYTGLKNRFTSIKCLDEGCPFCKAARAEGGHKVIKKREIKVYIKMLVSYIDPVTGALSEPVPTIWERNAGFIDQLDAKRVSLGNAPLSSFLFTLTKVKTADKTTYQMDVALPQVFPDTSIPKDFSAFANFRTKGFTYVEKTAEEMEEFIATGKFSTPVQTNQATQTPQTSQAAQTNVNQNVASQTNTVSQQAVQTETQTQVQAQQAQTVQQPAQTNPTVTTNNSGRNNFNWGF